MALTRSRRRPREGGDPYAVSPMFWISVSDPVERPRCNHDRQGLWVPACAGTTRKLEQRTAHSFPSPFPRAHIPKQKPRDLALLDFLAAFGDAVAAVVAVDVL